MEQRQTEKTNESRTIVATRVRIIMQQNNLTLAALAVRCGLPPSNLSSMINGKRNPTLDTLDRLADALGVDTWQLLTDAGTATTATAAPTPAQDPQQAAESPQDAADVADLITVDPHTGEAHRYRLIS